MYKPEEVVQFPGFVLGALFGSDKKTKCFQQLPAQFEKQLFTVPTNVGRLDRRICLNNWSRKWKVSPCWLSHRNVLGSFCEKNPLKPARSMDWTRAGDTPSKVTVSLIVLLCFSVMKTIWCVHLGSVWPDLCEIFKFTPELYCYRDQVALVACSSSSSWFKGKPKNFFWKIFFFLFHVKLRCLFLAAGSLIFNL